MSHQVPEYFRYVSDITIDNPGSGYTSIPTITISGGGGTGATATATIFNSQIQAVNITNVGKDYTTAPDVIVTGGGGSNADLTAVLAFAAGTPTDYEEKSALGIKYTLPEFIQNDYNKFVTFIEKYYEYMDSDGNPSNILLNKRYNDIDDLNDAELNKRALELAENFPQILQTDKKTLFKNIKNIYESKGSERSIKAYFRLLYNEDVEVYYPSKNILRASDGIWIEENSLRVTSGFNNYEVLNLNGRVADLKYYETIGSVTLLRSIEITIPRVEKIAYTSPQAYEVVIELPAGVTDVPGPGSQATATATIVAGEITKINKTFGGYGYTAAPIVEIYDTNGGTGATARAVVTNGAVTSIIVNDGGSGYDPLTTSVTFNTESLRSFIVEHDSNDAEENIRAYLDRSLSSVTSGTYLGLNAGFSVGDVFAVNESGDDGTGYAIPGYFAGDYTFTGGSNNAVIRVAAIDINGVPTSWSIINPGEGFRNAQTVITLTSKTGEELDVTLFTKYLYSYDGKYKDDRGKLSDVNRLQDNYKYQSYSYIIKSTISQNQWVKRFKDLMHPAGMEVFGDLIITNNINFGPFIEIITDGLNLHIFKTEDIVVSNDDSINIVVQWVREFTETQNATEISSFEVQKALTDFAGASSEFDDDVYVEPDYLPEYYVGPGLSKHVDKNLTETATILDALSTSVDYNRTLTDQISNITDSILIAVLVSRILSDSTNAATDEIALSVDKSFVEVPTTTDLLTLTLALSRTLSDSVTTNEINSIAVDKLLDDVSSSSDVINIESAKPISDSATASEILATLTSYTRSFDEALGSSDAINIESAKSISDSVSTADILSSILSFANNLTDTATVNDSIVASLDISRVIYCDAAAAGELNSIEVDKSLLEITSASDDYYQEYVEGDYLPLNYTGSGISKYVEKVLTNVVSHIEYVSINIDKGVIVEERTASEINIKTLQKPFTETGNIADGGVITIQDYSDPTFFSEDYVGVGYNF